MLDVARRSHHHQAATSGREARKGKASTPSLHEHANQCVLGLIEPLSAPNRISATSAGREYRITSDDGSVTLYREVFFTAGF